MNKHEKELKKPDAFIAEGRKVIFILEKNLKPIAGLVVAVVVVLLGIFFVNNASEKKEMTLQSDYYRIEKAYLKKLEDAQKAKMDKLEKSAADKTADKKNLDPKEAVEDSVKDSEKYKEDISQFTALVNKAPESKAGAMAALAVANLSFKSKNWEDGQKILEQVYKHQKKNNLIKGLLAHSLGVAQANLGKCDLAIQTWASLIKEKNYEFMADELKLKTAICQQQLGQNQQAEESLNALKAKTESPQSRVADKYLRFFKFKQQGS
jgi:predicted negative regulator of RcsB-dependent stress response